MPISQLMTFTPLAPKTPYAPGAPVARSDVKGLSTVTGLQGPMGDNGPTIITATQVTFDDGTTVLAQESLAVLAARS